MDTAQIETRAQLRLSTVARSNLYTMGVTSAHDERQVIPEEPGMPSEEVRKLRAQLILEEAIETAEALGFMVSVSYKEGAHCIRVEPFFEPDLEKIIDGCCDTNYVCIGTLCALGLEDLPHLEEVNRANDRKFPGGVALTNENGKFQKPEGWQGPDHHQVMKDRAALGLSLAAMSRQIVTARASELTRG